MWSLDKTRLLVDLYNSDNTVLSISKQMNISKSSVTNKLVKLGIYRPPVKKAVLTKKMLVRQLNDLLDGEFWTFDKANKDELILLVNTIRAMLRRGQL